MDEIHLSTCTSLYINILTIVRVRLRDHTDGGGSRIRLPTRDHLEVAGYLSVYLLACLPIHSSCVPPSTDLGLWVPRVCICGLSPVALSMSTLHLAAETLQLSGLRFQLAMRGMH